MRLPNMIQSIYFVLILTLYQFVWKSYDITRPEFWSKTRNWDSISNKTKIRYWNNFKKREIKCCEWNRLYQNITQNDPCPSLFFNKNYFFNELVTVFDSASLRNLHILQVAKIIYIMQLYRYIVERGVPHHCT